MPWYVLTLSGHMSFGFSSSSSTGIIDVHPGMIPGSQSMLPSSLVGGLSSLTGIS
jgi:hypothetical protein